QLSLALNYAIGLFDVRVYHAWNLAIHAGCVLLLFALLRRALMLPSVDRRLRRPTHGIDDGAVLSGDTLREPAGARKPACPPLAGDCGGDMRARHGLE